MSFLNQRLPPASQPFRYKPIHDNSDEIRLIRLIAPDTVEIFHASLVNVPKYRALSYVWGTADCQTPLFISAPGQGRRQMKIKENCMQAISRLYLDDPITPIWIDAICINQTNTLERNHQVQRMGQIYSSADKVQIFLGKPGDPDDRPWLELLDSVAQKQRQPSADMSWLLTISQEPKMQLVLNAPYFSRRWVLQEEAYAEIDYSEPNLPVRKTWMKPDYRKGVLEVKNEILEREWWLIWKWFTSTRPQLQSTDRAALTDKQGRLRTADEVLRYVLSISDQENLIFTNVSRVWWWIYGPALAQLQNESAEMAMHIRLTFPYATNIKGTGVFCDPLILRTASNVTKRAYRRFQGFPLHYPLYVELDRWTIGIARLYSSSDLDTASAALARFRKLVQLRFDLHYRKDGFDLANNLVRFDARLTGLSDSLKQRVDASSETDIWKSYQKAELQLARSRFTAKIERQLAVVQDAVLFSDSKLAHLTSHILDGKPPNFLFKGKYY